MLTVKPKITDKIFTDISSEYADKLISYPLITSLAIPTGVYVTEQIFTFWEDVSVYLPYGTKLLKGYVRPDGHAFNGLEKLVKT